MAVKFPSSGLLELSTFSTAQEKQFLLVSNSGKQSKSPYLTMAKNFQMEVQPQRRIHFFFKVESSIKKKKNQEET